MNFDIEQKQLKPKKFYQHLYIQVLIAILCGVSFGYFDSDLGEYMISLCFGFINLVKMIIAPVIFLTVTTGIAGMSDLKKVGRVAGKAFIYFFTFSTLALMIGLVVSHIVQPGKGLNIDPSTLNGAEIEKYVQAAHDNSLVSFIFNIIPATLFSPLTGDHILQVLLVAILFGVALAMTSEKSQPVQDFLQTLTIPIFKIVEILMKLAPIGAFGAMAFTIGKYGVASLRNLAMLVGTFYLTSALFVILILGSVAWYN